MFEVPEAKRVRRADLYSSRSSSEPSEPDAELSAQLQSRLANVYGSALDNVQYVDAPARNVPLANTEDEQEQDAALAEEGYEFRLFATSMTKDIGKDTDTQENGLGRSNASRIILGDEAGDGEMEEGGFMVPHRDRRYYFTFADIGQGEARKREFDNVAVSGEQVKLYLQQRYKGLEVPWRVRTIVTRKRVRSGPGGLGLEQEQRIEELGDGSVSRKKKPGKKRRVILRMRKRVGEELKEKMAKEAEEKEKASREKRTRRNREKKVKRKAKAEAQKTAGVADDSIVLESVALADKAL